MPGIHTLCQFNSLHAIIFLNSYNRKTEDMQSSSDLSMYKILSETGLNRLEKAE